RRRGDELIAVLFLDLDSFKTVNDGLGHEAGDELLRNVAARIAKRVRAEDTLARFGGDEFVLLVEDLSSPDDAERIANDLIAAFALPFPIQGREVYVGLSIGIALTESYSEPSVVLRNADAALYRAKSTGRNRSVIFDPHMTTEALARLELETDLRRALDDGTGLFLHYQPIFDLETRQISGCEALVRWAHPSGAVLAPDAFIPLAEETGLIVPLGQWVLTEACRQLRRWQLEHDVPELTVSVNLSSRHFRERHLVNHISEVLDATQLSPAHLILEVTEHVLVDAAARTTLAGLKSLGVGLAIDDFGTGYSSLNYLSAIDADILKIDRRFVSGLPSNGREAAIVRAVLALGDSLDLIVIAEGVETVEQMLALRRLGCHRVQGYLLGRPSAADAFVGLFGQKSVAAGSRPEEIATRLDAVLSDVAPPGFAKSA
ncbi:MAG: bifunctional diguanylate cyclase/phosphodiesterase, partial [Thermomicrobiales bacterium]|nr:bifunctional diguanylate cyclase/phosphodiesterase [Thermomicrobiales bacterium]